MVTFNALMIRTETMRDFTKAQALVDWIYWSQTDSSAAQIASSYDNHPSFSISSSARSNTGRDTVMLSRSHMVVASLAQPAKATLLEQLASVTSNGVQVFSLANCIYEGTICFDLGKCVSGACVCNSNREGDFCENAKSAF
jgi:hypothetical protein